MMLRDFFAEQAFTLSYRPKVLHVPPHQHDEAGMERGLSQPAARGRDGCACPRPTH